MQLTLTDLLKRALLVGAVEVKLVPGRRTIVVLPQGESEVKGETQTPERIDELVGSVLTPEARRAMRAGFAEWTFPLEGKGVVRANAELKLGLPHVSLFLDGCYGNQPPPAPPEPQGVSAPREAPEDDEPRRALPTEPPLPPEARVFGAGLSGESTAAIDRILLAMLDMNASDLHISSGVEPLVRVDGELRRLPGHAAFNAESVQRALLPLVPPRNREEFARVHDTDFAYELSGKARFRANLFVDMHGMAGVFRVIPAKIRSVEELSLPRELLSLCRLPKGLVLVTGPTGSGKSTTLAALIDYINRSRNDHIITIEDPIEFVHANKKCLINQRQVGEHTDSFKRALRAALREDPDIILLGEMRDLETISIALETAETGHLVFGTLHTSTAPSTIDRIIDQYPAAQQNQVRAMLATSLKGVICQMLCKKIGGGRVAALEVMFGVPAIANLIREEKIFQIPSIIQTNRKSGMCLLNDSLWRLVQNRVVTPEEALSKTVDRPGLLTGYQQNGVHVAEA